jgi:hypothetical protein
LYFGGVFIVEEVGGVGDTGSGDTTTFDVPTLQDKFLSMPLRSVCFTDAFFLPLVKSNYSPQVSSSQDF